MWGCFFKGPEANQPTEVAAQLETIEVNEDLFKELQEAVQQDEANTHEIDDEVVNTPKEENHHKKKSKRKTTQDDVLEAQYKALILKQENLKLKKEEIGVGSVPFGTKIMFYPYCVYKFRSMNV